MTATEELKPCPICGGQPDFQHFNIVPNVQGRIICACGIELRQGANDTEDDMRIIWNTRSDYAVQAANERKSEQAIAATLGNDEYESRMDELLCRLTNGKWSKSRSYSVDFMVGCIDEAYEDAYAGDFATLGGGKLTAEQVEKVIMSSDYWERVNNHPALREGVWQAIADELNAAMGSEPKPPCGGGYCPLCSAVQGECENESKDGFRCSKCGDTWLGGFNLGPIAFKRCPSCGAKVRKAVER